jgi:feruloyl esterase
VTAQRKALESANFSGIVDAPAQVTVAKFIAASGDMPAHCQAQGYVAPSVGFVLILPASNWNGKFLEQGCGGFSGSIDLTGLGSSIYAGPLSRGYAYLMVDGGHTAGGVSGMWAFNNLQAQVDFGVRAPFSRPIYPYPVRAKYLGQGDPKDAASFGPIER